jgi:hypothetical protein
MKGIRVTRFRRLVPVTAAAAAAAVAVVAVVAGCGGGRSSSGGGSFAFGADAACTRANKQIAALGTPQQAQVLSYLESTELVIEKLHKEVAALDGSGAAESAYVDGLAKAVPVLNKMANAARNENFDAVRELSNELIEVHLGELAEAAELKACAEVPASKS